MLAAKTAHAMISARSAPSVASAQNGLTVMTVATAHSAITNVLRTSILRLILAKALRPQMHQTKPRMVAMNPVMVDVKALERGVVVDVDVDAARSAAHGPTTTASPRTLLRLRWALQNPATTAKPLPAKQMRMQPSPELTAMQQVKPATNAPATAMAVSAARAKTAVTARTVATTSPATATM